MSNIKHKSLDLWADEIHVRQNPATETLSPKDLLELVTPAPLRTLVGDHITRKQQACIEFCIKHIKKLVMKYAKPKPLCSSDILMFRSSEYHQLSGGELPKNGAVSICGKIIMCRPPNSKLLALRITHELIHHYSFRRVTLQLTDTGFQIAMNSGVGRGAKCGNRVRFRGLNEACTEWIASQMRAQMPWHEIGLSLNEVINAERHGLDTSAGAYPVLVMLLEQLMNDFGITEQDIYSDHFIGTCRILKKLHDSDKRIPRMLSSMQATPYDVGMFCGQINMPLKKI